MSEKKVTPETGSYVVVDDVFVYTTKAGARLEIDLDLPTDVLKKATEGDEEKDDEAQMQVVLDWMGQESVDAFEGMRVLERARFARTFFDEFAKAAGLPLGESLSSSDSSRSTDSSSDGISAGI